MAGFGFIDDVDLCITDTNGDDRQVVKRMQDSLIYGWGCFRQLEVHLFQKNAFGSTSIIPGINKGNGNM